MSLRSVRRKKLNTTTAFCWRLVPFLIPLTKRNLNLVLSNTCRKSSIKTAELVGKIMCGQTKDVQLISERKNILLFWQVVSRVWVRSPVFKSSLLPGCRTSTTRDPPAGWGDRQAGDDGAQVQGQRPRRYSPSSGSSHWSPGPRIMWAFVVFGACSVSLELVH